MPETTPTYAKLVLEAIKPREFPSAAGVPAGTVFARIVKQEFRTNFKRGDGHRYGVERRFRASNNINLESSSNPQNALMADGSSGTLYLQGDDTSADNYVLVFSPVQWAAVKIAVKEYNAQFIAPITAAPATLPFPTELAF